MSEVIHIPGGPVNVGTQLRQRCAWCGAVLIDVDLATVQVAIDPDDPDAAAPTYPTWAPDELVGVNGPMSRTIPHEEGDPLPEGACARLPHDITGSRS